MRSRAIVDAVLTSRMHGACVHRAGAWRACMRVQVRAGMHAGAGARAWVRGCAGAGACACRCVYVHARVCTYEDPPPLKVLRIVF